MKRLILVLCVIAAPALAVQPDEMLDNPALEARARDISAGLRCLVCRNESIDESNADLARDLRLLVRERLVAGDSNEEAVAYIVDRYGEYVLLRPTVGGALYLRRRSRAAEPEARQLNAAEEARLREILRE
jgi:cytochrome c-type biogenesis protein CcmH